MQSPFSHIRVLCTKSDSFPDKKKRSKTWKSSLVSEYSQGCICHTILHSKSPGHYGCTIRYANISSNFSPYEYGSKLEQKEALPQSRRLIFFLSSVSYLHRAVILLCANVATTSSCTGPAEGRPYILRFQQDSCIYT